jgi:hypothetical protein
MAGCTEDAGPDRTYRVTDGGPGGHVICSWVQVRAPTLLSV